MTEYIRGYVLPPGRVVVLPPGPFERLKTDRLHIKSPGKSALKVVIDILEFRIVRQELFDHLIDNLGLDKRTIGGNADDGTGLKCQSRPVIAVEDILLAITVEKPEVEDAFKDEFKLLTATSVKTMEAAVLAARAFFRNIAAVRDHLNKVGFHEEEADQIATHLKKALFDSSLSLDRKLHLRYFVDKIDNLADEAEDAGDLLAIYSIKRSL